MRKFRVALVSAIVSVCALAAVGSASAATIGISPGGSATATAAGTLTLSGATILGNINIACNPLTFTTSLNTSTVAGSGNTAIGTVTGSSISGCGTGNAVSFLNLGSGRTWEVDGVPPFTTGTGIARALVIKNAQVNVSVFGGALTCLFQGDVAATLNAAGNSLSFATSIPKVSGASALCPSAGTLTGSAALSPTQTVTVS